MKSKKKSFIFPNLLILPMALHWLLPAGLENRLYIDFIIPFFLPNIAYFVYMTNYNRIINTQTLRGNDIRKIKTRGIIALIYCIFLVLFTVSLERLPLHVTNGLSIIYLPLIFFCYPLDYENIQKMKWPLAILLVIISMEVVLYGLGILAYTSAAGDNLTDGLYSTGGLFRINTTVGAATGTGVAIMMLGIIVCTFMEYNFLVRISLLVVASIGVLFTVSRGSSLVWLVYVAVLFYLNYFKQYSIGRKLVSIIVFIVGIYILNRFGVFDPLIERTEMINRTGDASTGRDDFVALTMKSMQESLYMGAGPGNIFPEKSIMIFHSTDNYIGIHNFYLLELAEIGIIGFILYISMFAPIFKYVRKKCVLSYMMVFVLLVTCNTEMIFAWAEFMPVFLLMVLCCINTQPVKYSYKQ